jgi:hypothetical protein
MAMKNEPRHDPVALSGSSPKSVMAVEAVGMLGLAA